MVNGVGDGASRQERVLCLNADTGELIWEYAFNIYMSDVPPRRVGWAPPVVDPDTGNVYVYGVGATLLAFSGDGKVLWERALQEELGVVTTHGGRTVSPVIEGELVIVSSLSSGWGNQARGSQRFFAFDKASGEAVWVSSPGSRPYDTTYSPPIATVIDGTRLLIAGGGDGAVHALKPQTGEPVWRFAMSKRGINSGTVIHGTTAIVSHGEENLSTSEMGLIAAIDASSSGEIAPDQTTWKEIGFLGGFSSPVLDGSRLYQIDNGANLVAFDVTSGSRLWTLNLGTIQRASPVFADGKLYVGTQNGKFYILKPGPDKCEILDEDVLGPQDSPEPIRGSVAISRGRVYVVSGEATYCFGKKTDTQAETPTQQASAPPGSPAHVQVAPTELLLKPGESVRLEARLFDAHGSLTNGGEASWSLEGIGGSISEDGQFTAAAGAKAEVGMVKATVGDISGAARVRVVPSLPWNEDFESIPVDKVPPHWIAAPGKFKIRDVEGNKVLVKLADNPFLRRARVYMGPSDLSDYAILADVRASEKRRQMGNAGVVAQRYKLVLFGNHQRLELHPWQAEPKRTVRTSFSWEPDTWYRMKLQVETLDDGTVRARGKVWPRGEEEPSAWTIEKIDPLPNLRGSPGIYADAPAEIFFDNLEVRQNQ
jgi:outer membrane protein assembly factor BamB